MKLFGKLYQAQFVSRPNRFIVQVRLQGKVIDAYLSNPGRLQELLFVGVTLLIESTTHSKGRMDWRAVGILQGDQSICLHTHAANDIATHLINQGAIAALTGWKVIKREHTVGHSRFDLLLEKNGVTRLGEVKSCTLFSSHIAMFPDAPSKRAVKHLTTLAELSPPEGPKPLVIFLVQKIGLQAFTVDWHTDLTLAQTLLAVRDKLEVLAIGVSTDPQMNLLPQVESLPILWDRLKQDAHDQGAYIYIIHLPEATWIKTPGFKDKQWEPGFYLYVGAEENNLTRQLASHQRVKKRPHLLIDSLRAHGTHHAALPIRSQKANKCKIAQDIKNLADFSIPDIDSSNCSCQSHLFRFDQDPLEKLEFYKVLFYHRIENTL